MAREGLTAVKFDALLKIAQKHGLNIVKKGGFTKAYPEGQTKGPSIGIPNTENVTRIEFVNFEHELGVKHPKPPAGSVKQMLNFGQDEKLILKDLDEICEHLTKLAKKAEATDAKTATAEKAEEKVEEIEEEAGEELEDDGNKEHASA